jgi:hypothetical protein
MSHDITRRQAFQALTWASVPYLLTVNGRAVGAPAATPGDYVGVIDIRGGRIALSSDGQQALVYICNGTDKDPATIGKWLHGDSAGDSIHASAAGVTVAAKLQGDRASGSVTMADGRAYRFLAGTYAYGQANAGLYRSAATFNGVPYVGGWIVNPDRGHAALPERASVQPVAWQAPLAPGVVETPSVVPVGLEEELDDYPRTSGAIINQQTGAILPYAAPNFATMTADVPGLGTFRLTRCMRTKCT